MKEIVLDASRMTDRENTHAYLKEIMGFPDYYGNNLDALYDCLTDIGEPTRVDIRNEDALKENLGRYATLLLHVFRNAAKQNDYLEVENFRN